MAHTGTYYLGNEFFVYDGNDAIGYATECALNINAETIDCSNKQSGIWASALPGQLSWTMSTSALYTTDAGYAELFDKFTQRQAVPVKFGTRISDSSTGLDTAATYFSGNAYITSLELSAGNNEVATYSVEFTGEGALTKNA